MFLIPYTLPPYIRKFFWDLKDSSEGWTLKKFRAWHLHWRHQRFIYIIVERFQQIAVMGLVLEKSVYYFKFFKDKSKRFLCKNVFFWIHKEAPHELFMTLLNKMWGMFIIILNKSSLSSIVANIFLKFCIFIKNSIKKKQKKFCSQQRQSNRKPSDFSALNK